MSTSILITVLTPYKSRGSWIEKCVDNFLSQECVHAEQILIVDKDDEESLQKAQKASLRSIQTRVIQQDKTGLSNALNFGIQAAKGEILSILNVDDFYETGILNRILSLDKALLSSHFLVGNVQILDDNDDLLSWNKPNTASVRSWYLGSEFPWNPTGYFYPKNLHDKIGLYNPAYTASLDLEFLCRAVKVIPFMFFDEHWGNHRHVEDSITMRALRNHSLQKINKEIYLSHLSRFEQLSCKLIQNGKKLFSGKRRRINRL